MTLPLEGVERVEQRDRVCVKAPGFHDDPARSLARLVDPVDQLVFAVGLAEDEIEPKLSGQRPAIALHIGQRLAAIDLRLALAQQVQVRPVEQ